MMVMAAVPSDSELEERRSGAGGVVLVGAATYGYREEGRPRMFGVAEGEAYGSEGEDEDEGHGGRGGGDGGAVLGKICSEEFGKVANSGDGVVIVGGGGAAGLVTSMLPPPVVTLPPIGNLTLPPITIKGAAGMVPKPTPPLVPSKRRPSISSSSANVAALGGGGNSTTPGNSPPCPYESTCKIADECRIHSGRCGLYPTRLAETFYGYVETVEDAVLIVEACRHGKLMRVKRRLHEKERQGIRSGSVFVFVERESGIRRWTDGKVWSPSRICGEFLLYRELETRQAVTKRTQPNQVNWGAQVAKMLGSGGTATAKMGTSFTPNSSSSSMSVSPVESHPNGLNLDEEQGNLDDDSSSSSPSVSQSVNGPASSASSKSSQMVFKKDGLIKKTISLTVADETYHLICYFKDSNLGTDLLALAPCRSVSFKNLEICRNPISYPIMMIQPQTGCFSTTGGQSQQQLAGPVRAIGLQPNTFLSLPGANGTHNLGSMVNGYSLSQQQQQSQQRSYSNPYYRPRQQQQHHHQPQSSQQSQFMQQSYHFASANPFYPQQQQQHMGQRPQSPESSYSSSIYLHHQQQQQMVPLPSPYQSRGMQLQSTSSVDIENQPKTCAKSTFSDCGGCCGCPSSSSNINASEVTSQIVLPPVMRKSFSTPMYASMTSQQQSTTNSSVHLEEEAVVGQEIDQREESVGEQEDENDIPRDPNTSCFVPANFAEGNHPLQPQQQRRKGGEDEALEEEQLLFCHFLESVQQQQH